MAIQLRPGSSADPPAVAKLDIAANHDHPVVTIPFPTPSDCQAIFLDRYTYFFNNPEYHLIIATSDAEIVGFLLWTKWKKPGEVEQPKWEPKMPEGTKVKLFETLIPVNEKDKEKYAGEDLHELEALAVSSTQQRRGIGSLLLKDFVKTLDGDHADCYIRSSSTAKPLYEKFGWKTRGEIRANLSEFGMKEEYVTYSMKRDAVNAGSI